MSRDPQRLQDYLRHILLAIKRIKEYCCDIDAAVLNRALMDRR